MQARRGCLTCQFRHRNCQRYSYVKRAGPPVSNRCSRQRVFQAEGNRSNFTEAREKLWQF